MSFAFVPLDRPAVAIPDFVSAHPLFGRHTPLAYHAFGNEWLAARGAAYYAHPPPILGSFPIPLPWDVECMLRHFDMSVWYDDTTSNNTKTAVSLWLRRLYATSDGYQMLLCSPHRPPVGLELAQLVTNFWEVMYGPGARRAAAPRAVSSPPGFAPAWTAPGDVSVEEAGVSGTVAGGEVGGAWLPEDYTSDDSSAGCEVSFDEPVPETREASPSTDWGEGVPATNGGGDSKEVADGGDSVLITTPATATEGSDATLLAETVYGDESEDAPADAVIADTSAAAAVFPGAADDVGVVHPAAPASPQTPETIIKTPKTVTETPRALALDHDTVTESAGPSPKIRKGKKQRRREKAAATRGVEEPAATLVTEQPATEHLAGPVPETVVEAVAEPVAPPQVATEQLSPKLLNVSVNPEPTATGETAAIDEGSEAATVEVDTNEVDTNEVDTAEVDTNEVNASEAGVDDQAHPDPANPLPNAKTQKRNRNRRIQNKKKKTKQHTVEVEEVTDDQAAPRARINPAHIAVISPKTCTNPKYARTSPRGYATPAPLPESANTEVIYVSESSRRNFTKSWQTEEVISHLTHRRLQNVHGTLVTPTITDESASVSSSVSGASTEAAGAKLDAIITGQLGPVEDATKTFVLPVIPVDDPERGDEDRWMQNKMTGYKAWGKAQKQA
ncbi:hypothetical protein Q8F55_006331 [Vanrija albida]|uniref:Uncharacterized protein n=1 Tax=Vanrija albida TaxID=181172 RepID=A0ABR3PWS6_9TREE